MRQNALGKRAPFNRTGRQILSNGVTEKQQPYHGAGSKICTGSVSVYESAGDVRQVCLLLPPKNFSRKDDEGKYAVGCVCRSRPGHRPKRLTCAHAVASNNDPADQRKDRRKRGPERIGGLVVSNRSRWRELLPGNATNLRPDGMQRGDPGMFGKRFAPRRGFVVTPSRTSL